MQKQLNTNLEIPENIKYLEDFISKLPKNCIFDKGKISAAGSTIALTNNENYVIAVPYVAMIENKISQLGESIFGVLTSGCVPLIRKR